jgi:hypothetical protein
MAQQDHQRCTGPLVGGGEVASERRLLANQLERVRRDCSGREQFRATTPLADGGRHAMHQRHARERRRLLLPILEVRVRKAATLAGCQIQEAVVPFDEREPLEQHRVGDGEHNGVDTDTNGQRQHRHRGKSRCPPEHPDRDDHIATDVLEPDKGSAVAVEILGVSHAAEPSPRRQARLFGRQAASRELVSQQREMAVDLPLQSWRGGRRTNRLPQPLPRPAGEAHDEEPGSRSLSTRPASRRQRSACVFSARAPARVSA